MPISKDDFEKHGFVHTHDIVMKAQIPEFVRRGAASRDASIYLWMSPTPGRETHYDVMYVGKAGAGVAQRMLQHRGGFVNSGTGRANAALIAQLLDSGERWKFTREFRQRPPFSEEVFLYAAEEDAACRLFEPLWNRARFPGQSRQAGMPNVMTMPRPAAQREIDEGQVALVFQHIPNGEEVLNFLSSLSEEDENRFLALVKMMQVRDPSAPCRVIMGYTDQPSGYNMKPMLVLGPGLLPDGKRARWVARIPLVNDAKTPLTVLLPKHAMAPSLARERVAFSPKDSGDWTPWRPLDLTAFLDSPETYLR